MIDGYLKVLSTKDVELPAGYHDVLRETEDIRTALCHERPETPSPRRLGSHTL